MSTPKPAIPALFFIIDVESIGLHGEAFAVAGGVYQPNGAALYEFSFACPSSGCDGTAEDRRWVNENVPILEETHRSQRPMRDAFWAEWMKAKAGGAVMAAECLWPVEASFVAKCIADDPEARKWEGPYPFYEISTFMAAAEMDPMATYDRTPSEMPKHNPLADVRQSARLLAMALDRLNRCLTK